MSAPSVLLLVSNPGRRTSLAVTSAAEGLARRVGGAAGALRPDEIVLSPIEPAALAMKAARLVVLPA